MKGLEISRSFFEKYRNDFLPADSPFWGKIAVGLLGHGSECWGYDDEISRDHDFDFGFQIWLSEADEEEIGFDLLRAYARLPETYEGLRRDRNDYYGAYRGVKTIEDFCKFYLPNARLPEMPSEWLAIPDEYLAEATNGEIFYDGSGELTHIRQVLSARPEDVRLKKLASELWYAAQTGQYNYKRCLDHGEKGAAALALSSFAEHIIKCVYLIRNAYSPYYKWLFRGLDKLGETSFKQDVESLLESPFSRDNISSIDKICSSIVDRLIETGLVNSCDVFLEPQAIKINSLIKDHQLRSMDIML